MKTTTLALKIATALPEVTPEEWHRWVIEADDDLSGAIARSEKIAADETVRPSTRRANRLIASAMRRALAEGLDRANFKEFARAVWIVLSATTLRGLLGRLSCTRCGYILDRSLAPLGETTRCPGCGAAVTFTTDPAAAERGAAIVDFLLDSDRDTITPVYLYLE